MADELTIDAEQYISSKRASELSGYEQDYIGQLCRGGNIMARRVGGLWYVSPDSLIKYKERADKYKPEPPVAHGSASMPDSLVSFEGKGHISTSRAAKMTGYTPDYVGQLARAGTIPSRQVGNRWYVEQSGLLKHKESKDALLGALQAESVGIKTPITSATKTDSHYKETEQFFRYTSDNREFMPSTGAATAGGPSTGDLVKSDAYSIGPSMTPSNEELTAKAKDEEEYVVPIHISHQTRDMARIGMRNSIMVVEPKHSMLPMLLPVGLFTIVIVLSLGFISLKRSSIYTNNAIKENISISQLASAGVVGKFADFLETWIAPELVYRRAE
jgi:hypothetical protein